MILWVSLWILSIRSLVGGIVSQPLPHIRLELVEQIRLSCHPLPRHPLTQR